MRTSSIFLFGVFCAVLAAQNATISPRFQTVYIVGMANGRDQYLASRLTSGRVLWVVSDPKNADAVLTDSVDGDFWTWITQTYPAGDHPPSHPEQTGAFWRDAASRNKGTVFLVDPRRHLILWSIYDRAKDTTSDELDRNAARIAGQLKSAFGKK